MMNELPNLLTAASILLALITALYGLFFQSIQSALDFKPKLHSRDNITQYKLVKNTFKSKLIPLLVGSSIITLIFLPEFINQINDSIKVIWQCGLVNTSYNTLAASFMAVCGFCISFTIVIVFLGFKMKRQINKLNP